MRQHPEVLVLHVANGFTPFGEGPSPYLLEFLSNSLRVAGISVDTLSYHPERIARDLQASAPAVVFNLAYGYRDTVHDERQPDIVARLDFFGVTYVGSVAAAQTLAQDKREAKHHLWSHGVATPATLDDRDWPDDVEFVVIKPRFGAAHQHVRVVGRRDADLNGQLASRCLWLTEEYVNGAEYTVSILEDDKGLRVLPPIRVWFEQSLGPRPILQEGGRGARLSIAENPPRVLAQAARRAFVALGLRDYARFDFRINSRGLPVMLDANALPGLHPVGSPFVLAANAAGIDCHHLYPLLARRALNRAEACAIGF